MQEEENCETDPSLMTLSLIYVFILFRFAALVPLSQIFKLTNFTLRINKLHLLQQQLLIETRSY